MVKKNASDNDLVKFCYSCVLFKKYYQYNLWFGSFDEYKNIEYCKKYIQQYLYYWIYFFLLQRLSLSFFILLYRSPCFIKFVEFGFFKYLDYHFLLLFHNNHFTFDSKGKQKINSFIKSYFQKFLKKSFKKDLLVLVTKEINKIILNILLKYVTKRLKSIDIYIVRDKLNIKTSFNLVLNSSNNINLRSAKLTKLSIEKGFIGLQKKISYGFNKDIHSLIDSFTILKDFNNQQKNIGLYKNSSVLFKEFPTQKDLRNKKYFKTFNK